MYQHKGTIKILISSLYHGSHRDHSRPIVGEGQTKEAALQDLLTKLQDSSSFRQYFTDGSWIDLDRAEECVPDTYPETHGLLVLRWRHVPNWVVNEVYAIPRGTIVLGSLGEIVIGDQPAVRSGSEEADPILLLPEGSMRAQCVSYAPITYEWVPWDRVGVAHR